MFQGVCDAEGQAQEGHTEAKEEGQVTVDIAARLRELEAQSLESYRTGKDGPPVLYREAGKFLKADGDKPMLFVASEESPDRMGDVIEVSGWQLDQFKQNPVFMLAHSHDSLPIGAVTGVGVEGKQLLASVQFDNTDPIAANVKGKYERGFMHAVSVGFRALEYEPVSGQGSRQSFRFKKTELLELSAVAVPAHPAALARRAMLLTPPTPYFSIPVKVEVKPEPTKAQEISAVDVERLRDGIRRLKE